MNTKMFTVNHQWADDLIMMSILSVHEKNVKVAVHLLLVTSLFWSKIVFFFFCSKKNGFWLDFCSRSWLSYERQKYDCRHKIIVFFVEHFPVKFDWRFAYSLSVCEILFFLQNIQASYQSATLLKQVIITMLTLLTGFACSARCYLMKPVWMNKPCKEKCKTVYKCIFYCSFKIVYLSIWIIFLMCI